MKSAVRLFIVSAAMCVLFMPQTVLGQRTRVIQMSSVEALFPDSLSADALRKVDVRRTDTVPASAGNVALVPGQYLASTVDSVAAKEATRGGELLVLPFRYLGTNADASAELFLRPVVEIEGGGMRYRGATLGYHGSILLGLEDSLETATSEDLGGSIRFQLVANADTVQPDTLAIDHTNLPFERVRLTAASPGDSIRLHVRTTFHPGGVDVWIPVQRPRLTVGASPEKIQGFGLETTTLVIRASEPGVGGPIALTSTRGNPEPNSADLLPDGIVEATIRSSGTGVSEIRVSSSVFVEASGTVEFVFPFAFLIAALLGGLLGGLAAAFQRRRNKQPAPIGWYAVSGTLIGLVVAVLYAVGVNVLGIAFSARAGEALVFALGFLGGFFGGGVLEGLRPGPQAP